MALDGANFIAELSITDPPGSDPLSQGDDQIRTIKRATFQSFPLIAAAVNLTDVQMNLMAIKNEANIFTESQTIKNGNLVLDDTGVTPVGIVWQKSGIDQWFITQAGATDLRFARHDVLGAFVDDWLRVNFTTGVADFAQVPTVQGAPLWVAGEIRQFISAATPGTNWFVADGTNGTVNLTGRHLMTESAFDTLGTAHNAALDTVTSAAGVTGSTAITEAQMPAHNHTVWMTNNPSGGITDIQLNATDNVFGGRRNDSSKQFAKSNGTRDVIGNAGSGSGHNHADGGNAMVLGEPTFTNTVRPVGFVVRSFQYVP